MSTLHINTILDKLDELRAIFVLGQRAVPFLEEMFCFLKDISSLLDEINESIRDSTVKMPHASSRLESVSQATEMATTEILDLVDSSLVNLGQLKDHVEESVSDIELMTRADARMIRVLRAALRGHDEALLAKIEVIHHDKTILRRRIGQQLKSDVDAFDEVRNKLHHIMIALQVQDITAQQLAAVNHLIESIRTGMRGLMVRLGSEDGSTDRAPTRRFAAFDPNAQYDRSGKRQRAADAVIHSFSEQQAPASASVPASQDSIDQLFGGDGVAASQDSIDQLFGGAAGSKSEPASQDSIDQLFNAKGGGTASQADIDKLFQNGS